MSPTRILLAPIVAFTSGLLAFTGVAHAATAVEPTNGTLLDLLKPVLAAFGHGQKLYAGCLALVLLVAVVRRQFDKDAWVHTDLGAAALTLAGSFGATLAVSLAGGAGVTWTMVWHAISIAFGAAGGYTMVKHLLVTPYLAHLADKGPAWLHAPAKLVLWIFQVAVPDAPPATGNTQAPPNAQ